MSNEPMIQVWNQSNARRWLKLRGTLMPQLEPYGDAAMAALAPRQGESALDVGCGTGETTRALALRTGRALGVDVSAPLLEVARAEGGARYLLADAQTHPFDEAFDIIYSRFGVMFFDDPGAAFANLRASMRPRGRLGAVAWGPFERNLWAKLPLEVVRRHMKVAAPGSGPGPFALSDQAALERLLARAGFADVSVAPIELPFAADAAMLLESGPAGVGLREAGEAGERLRPALEIELARELPGELRGL